MDLDLELVSSADKAALLALSTLEWLATAKSILNENRDALIRIAEALLERESLDASEIKLLIAGEPLEERRVPKVEPRSEKPTPSGAKVVRPTPPFPQERPCPA